MEEATTSVLDLLWQRPWDEGPELQKNQVVTAG